LKEILGLFQDDRRAYRAVTVESLRYPQVPDRRDPSTGATLSERAPHRHQLTDLGSGLREKCHTTGFDFCAVSPRHHRDDGRQNDKRDEKIARSTEAHELTP